MHHIINNNKNEGFPAGQWGIRYPDILFLVPFLFVFFSFLVFYLFFFFHRWEWEEGRLEVINFSRVIDDGNGRALQVEWKLPLIFSPVLSCLMEGKGDCSLRGFSSEGFHLPFDFFRGFYWWLVGPLADGAGFACIFSVVRGTESCGRVEKSGC
ncbi:hypothetical protein B0J12DRAFT_404139 [Macrophomina phaseolina]|uniref:Transmembrane protein n=1 Tax=Macrophomina phaseolina TaxID=35725 RepID=A0ABQ8GIR3_9PEZI|nr:hypothetical protein B0J12DRAFT_404139 [Macrophomina phaseolina]